MITESTRTHSIMCISGKRVEESGHVRLGRGCSGQCEGMGWGMGPWVVGFGGVWVMGVRVRVGGIGGARRCGSWVVGVGRRRRWAWRLAKNKDSVASNKRGEVQPSLHT